MLEQFDNVIKTVGRNYDSLKGALDSIDDELLLAFSALNEGLSKSDDVVLALNKIQGVVSTLKNDIETATDAANAGLGALKEGIEEIAEEVGEAASEIGEDIKDGVAEISEAISNTVSNVSNAVKSSKKSKKSETKE